jgi:hypothetical protein
MFQTSTVSVTGLHLLTYQEKRFSCSSSPCVVVLSGFLRALNLLLLGRRRRPSNLPGTVKVVGSDRPIPVCLAWLGTTPSEN